MAFATGPSWAYKDVITSARLAQMVENTRAHDHRADGSQGAPLGEIVTPNWTAAAASVTTNAGMGSLAIPALATPSYLGLMVVATPGTAASSYQAVTITDPTGRVDTDFLLLRTPITGASVTATTHTHWLVRVAAGAAGTVSFAIGASIATTVRLKAGLLA